MVESHESVIFQHNTNGSMCIKFSFHLLYLSYVKIKINRLMNDRQTDRQTNQTRFTDKGFMKVNPVSVSYTHLTLPTICSV